MNRQGPTYVAHFSLARDPDSNCMIAR